MNTPSYSRMRLAGLVGLLVLGTGCATARNHLDLGVRYERAGDYEAAVKAYTHAIEMEPGNALAYFDRACAGRKLGDLESAIADFSKTLELQPDLAAAALGRAHAHFSQEDYAEAVSDFTRTIELVPDQSEAYLGRGIANRMMGEDELARADFDKAIGIDPYSVPAFRSRADLKAQTGDLPGALDDYARAIRLAPRSAGAHYNAGIVREWTGDVQGAMADYRDAARLSPDYAARAKRRLEICAARLSSAADLEALPAAAAAGGRPDPFSEWESGVPEAHEPVQGPLSAVLGRAGQVPGLSSLIVVRGGRIVAESYFDGLGRHQVRPVRSVTKSVLSLLVGIALQEGMLRCLGQPLNDLFASVPGADPGKWRQMTVRELIELGAGMDWIKRTDWEFQEATPELLNRPIDHLEFDGLLNESEQEIYIETAVLNALRYHRISRNAQLVANSGVADVLSLALAKASGLSTLEFADSRLFEPLGIIKRRWGKTGPVAPNGSAGLFLRPLDMAKLGQMVVDKGVLDGREVVPPAWIEESLKPRRKVAGKEYGYMWQLGARHEPSAVLAAGFGGQAILCLPEQELVVVTTGAIGPQDSPRDLERQTEGIFAFVSGEVLPALLKEGPAPSAGNTRTISKGAPQKNG
jgi:CubicO group peptidase (beta-lactamase class C family)/Flp pilus assembly protein TadD